MGGSLNEAERPEQSPGTANQARPVTLSVVIDGRLDAARARQVATLADRLGLAGIWLRYPWWPLGGTATSGTHVAGLLSTLASGVGIEYGLVLDADAADPGEADGAWLDHLAPAAVSQAAGLPPGPRIALAGSPSAVTRWRDLIWQRPSLAVPRLARPVGDGEGNRAGDGVGVGVGGVDAGRPVAAVFVPCAPGRDLTGEVSAAATAAAGRPVLAEVTVSVGRTDAEARARADADELFTLAGHPAAQGLFGTLEECQASAARLAQAGATELVCYLPLAADLPDVLAQLRSIAIGAAVLRPGEPPSAAPPPPADWGGRRRNMQNDAALVQDSEITFRQTRPSP
jgi:hypothetical protein